MAGGKGPGMYDIPRSRGWVTQAAMLLALPPNQKGYLILGALCLFSFLSALFACDSAFAPGDSATSLMVTAVSQVSSFILLSSLFFPFHPFFHLCPKLGAWKGEGS